MKTFFALITVAALLLYPEMGFANSPDFRKAKWGMTKKQVFSSEKKLKFSKSFSSDIDSEETYLSEYMAIGRTLVIAYIFYKNKLIQAKYLYFGTKDNRYCHQKDYSDLRDFIIAEYGNPKQIKNDNHEEQATFWEVEGTFIELKREKWGIADYTRCEATFSSKELSHLIEERNKALDAADKKRAIETVTKILKKMAAENHCKKIWPDNFVMQKHCLDEQESAIKAMLTRSRPHDIPTKIFETINGYCSKTWPYNFVIRNHCYDEQITAWRELNSSNAD